MWVTSSMLAVLATVIVLSAVSSAHYHVIPDIDDLITGVRLTTDSSIPVRRQVEPRQPIRIIPFFDSSINANLTDVESLMLQNQIVPELITFLSKTLSVDRVQGPLLLNRACQGGKIFLRDNGRRDCISECQTTTCGPVVISDDHLMACVECRNGGGSNCTETIPTGNGVPNADLVIYISAIQSANCPQGSTSSTSMTVASASVCQMESKIDRPIAGNINFCPSNLQGRVAKNILDVAKHEITHALAFSANLFAFWRDSDGNPRTPRGGALNLPRVFNSSLRIHEPSSNTVRLYEQYNDWVTEKGVGEHSIHHVVTPAVLREARAHFDCPTLEGVELENQGGLGTFLSHWEKRILGNEALTGDLAFNPVFSAITLAAYEDSGWYDVNYTMAENLVWGKGAGCRFATGSCREWMDTQSAQNRTAAPYCHSDSGRGCTVDYQAVSKCNILNFTQTVPLDFQYFTSPSLGGRIQIADFCPFEDIFIIRSQDGSTRGTECSVPTNQPPENIFLESYGPGSRCVRHGTRPWYFGFSTGSGCYQYSCSPESGVSITIGGYRYNCTCEGEEIRFVTNGVTGSIICPACSQICYDDLENCPVSENPSCHGRIQETDRNSGTTSTTDNNNNNNNLASKMMPMSIKTITVLIITILWLY